LGRHRSAEDCVDDDDVMGGISCSLPLLLVAVAIVFIVVQLLNNNNSRVNAKAETRPQKLNGHYEQPQWGIVIDAGSSGSRIHIFRFNSPRDPDGLPLIHWPAAASLKQTPGLSTFAEPLAASRTLHPLLAFAAEHVRKPCLALAGNIHTPHFANVLMRSMPGGLLRTA
jgi:hypothetical protein